MKTAIVLTLAILTQAVGNVFLTLGMKAAATTTGAAGGTGMAAVVAHVLDGASEAAQRPEVWIGTALLIAFFVLCSAALSWADVSFVLPVTAAGYVLNVAAAHYFLHENVTPARYIGAVVIVVGVVFVSRSAASAGGRRS